MVVTTSIRDRSSNASRFKGRFAQPWFMSWALSADRGDSSAILVFAHWGKSSSVK